MSEPTPSTTREQWVEQALKELLAAGFNNTGGLSAYAEAIAINYRDKGYTPKGAVAEELSDLE